jgi:hypothetical protein
MSGASAGSCLVCGAECEDLNASTCAACAGDADCIPATQPIADGSSHEAEATTVQLGGACVSWASLPTLPQPAAEWTRHPGNTPVDCGTTKPWGNLLQRFSWATGSAAPVVMQADTATAAATGSGLLPHQAAEAVLKTQHACMMTQGAGEDHTLQLSAQQRCFLTPLAPAQREQPSITPPASGVGTTLLQPSAARGAPTAGWAAMAPTFVGQRTGCSWSEHQPLAKQQQTLVTPIPVTDVSQSEQAVPGVGKCAEAERPRDKRYEHQQTDAAAASAAPASQEEIQQLRCSVSEW